MTTRIVEYFADVIPGRAPLAREPGIQTRTQRLHLDSGSRAVARVRNDESLV